MTDLQVRYQTLQETKRANEAQERLKARQVAVEEQEGASNVALQESQRKKISAEIDKLSEEIVKIRADTRLSEAQRQKAIADAVQAYTKSVENVTKSVTGIVGLFA